MYTNMQETSGWSTTPNVARTISNDRRKEHATEHRIDKSTMIQVVAWFRQEPSHYLR